MARTDSGGRPFAALRNLCVTVLATCQTRLALLGNELQTQKQLALQQLVRTLAIVFCLAMALLLGIALLLVLMWEQRVAVLGVLFVLFLGLAGYFLAALRKAGAEAEPMFAASIAELQEDLRQLKAAAADGKDPR